MNMTRTQALALLNLEECCADADVSKAFRRLALRHHPDKIGGDGSAFKDFANARDVLLGTHVPRPHVSAAEAGRFVVYRVEGLTSWRARRVYIGLVDTAKKTVAQRMQEHRSRGPSCAAWLRAVPSFTWKRVDSAPTIYQGLQKEAVHTGWELRLQVGDDDAVRGACVVIVSKKLAPSKTAWQRQLAAARELSVLPAELSSAMRCVRASKVPDVVNHLQDLCHICRRTGHMASACPTQANVEEQGKPKKAKKNPKTMKQAMKKTMKIKKKSGALRAKAAADKGDCEKAAKIRFGKKGAASCWKDASKVYREKPANVARKKVLNKTNNKKVSVKAQKKAYDQTDAAKAKRKEREKQRRAALMSH
jgi:hypothetical protein